MARRQPVKQFGENGRVVGGDGVRDDDNSVVRKSLVEKPRGQGEVIVPVPGHHRGTDMGGEGHLRFVVSPAITGVLCACGHTPEARKDLSDPRIYVLIEIELHFIAPAANA